LEHLPTLLYIEKEDNKYMGAFKFYHSWLEDELGLGNLAIQYLGEG
jgi:hypothetical protein